MNRKICTLKRLLWYLKPRCTASNVCQIEIGERQFLYTDHIQTSKHLFQLFEDYCFTAKSLQEKYRSQITTFIGTEIDWIRESSRGIIESLLSASELDLFIGSVHHVHTIPIDYSVTMFQAALHESGGSLEKLYEDYFDAQNDMLLALKPPIVGHFDLIRLKSGCPNEPFKKTSNVWRKIQRNLETMLAYGGVMEVNSAALRKGLEEPYPKMEICQASEYIL